MSHKPAEDYARSPVKDWLIQGAPDPQLVNPNWEETNQTKIRGVEVRSVKHVVTNNGFLTEIFRGDWGLENRKIDQVFVRHLESGAVSAWHAHAATTDRLFCISGRVLIVLYDGRSNSDTARTLMQLRVGLERPSLVVVPSGVWHGIKNISSQPAILLNAVDQAYAYEAPDHWRIPANDVQIPFDFRTAG